MDQRLRSFSRERPLSRLGGLARHSLLVDTIAQEGAKPPKGRKSMLMRIAGILLVVLAFALGLLAGGMSLLTYGIAGVGVVLIVFSKKRRK